MSPCILERRTQIRDTGTDPIPGGNTNPYTYPTDPINQYDPSGQSWLDALHVVIAVATVAAFFTCTICAIAGYAVAAYSAYSALQDFRSGQIANGVLDVLGVVGGIGEGFQAFRALREVKALRTAQEYSGTRSLVQGRIWRATRRLRAFTNREHVWHQTNYPLSAYGLYNEIHYLSHRDD